MTTLQMIERQISMANNIGRSIATPEETRSMLKIGVTYKSADETLANLGLPPNRKEGYRGFQVKPSDGKYHPIHASGSDGHYMAGEDVDPVK